MNKLMIGVAALLLSGVIYADDSKTAMNAHWICTTNASSSDDVKAQEADKQMEKTQKSAADSFAFAAENCRDCTKITCESQE